jgi:hemerythrin-like metal-binding protein
MPMPDGVASLVEAGLRRVPGIRTVHLTIRTEPLQPGSDVPAALTERVWLQTATGRYGWLDLSVAEAAAFEAYEPYVRNLMNSIALHVESAHQRALLEQALAALREADRRKDDFLGVLSHELRNPLAPIRNAVYLLEHAAPGSTQSARAREIIRRQTQHLTRLVDDLLDVKRFSTGKFHIHTARLDLAQHVRETVEDMRPLFVSRSLALELRLPPDPLWIEGDATRLAQVVSNLLHNAAKFTDAGGHVRVSVERVDGGARVVVEDDGAGVAPELLPTVFEPFVQSESTIHRSRGGLGLGLPLARGIVELHGGSLVARSEGAGKGTEFVVTLPAAEAPGANPQVAAPEPSRSGCRVLLIEDNRDAAESLRDILAGLGGHEVHVATDGAAGVAAARAQAPDVVLCDLGLPVLDGYEVARRIRAATGPERHSRVVALSGYAAPEDVERAHRAGFDYHLAKPPALDLLLELVAEAPCARAAPTVPADLATGHNEVDAQHAAIIAEAARLRRAGPSAVRDSLRFLRHHTSHHFEYEEKLMEEVGYPHAGVHREQHAAFTSQLAQLGDRVEREGATPENVSALADAVERWVGEHVQDEDRRLAEFIRGRGAAAA